MVQLMPSNELGPCTPSLAVSDLAASVKYYTENLGFTCSFQHPDLAPSFAIVERGFARFMLKTVGQRHPQVTPQPMETCGRHDSLIGVSDLDAFARELDHRNTFFAIVPGKAGQDVQGLEVFDPDGNCCFFFGQTR